MTGILWGQGSRLRTDKRTNTITENFGACADSVYQAFFPLSPKVSLGLRLRLDEIRHQYLRWPNTVSSSKEVHCFYILCVLLFTTNNQCNTPVHVTLTDLLDSHIRRDGLQICYICNTLQKTITTLTFNMFNIHIHENIYLISPHTSMETFRYA